MLACSKAPAMVTGHVCACNGHGIQLDRDVQRPNGKQNVERIRQELEWRQRRRSERWSSGRACTSASLPCTALIISTI